MQVGTELLVVIVDTRLGDNDALCTDEFTRCLSKGGTWQCSSSDVLLYPSNDLAVPARYTIIIVKDFLFDHSKLGIEGLEMISVLAGTIKHYFEVSKSNVAEPFGYGRQERSDRPLCVVDHLGARWLRAMAEGCWRVGAVAGKVF